MGSFHKVPGAALVIVIIAACDESGQPDTEPVGQWELLVDSIVNILSNHYSTPSDWGMVSRTLDLQEDGSWIQSSEYPDTTYINTGTWYTHRDNLVLSYELGPASTRHYEMVDDRMILTRSATEANMVTRYVAVYLWLE